MRIKNNKIIYVHIAIIMILVLTGCSSQTLDDKGQEKLAVVKTALSKTEDLPEYQSFPGKISAENEVALAPKIGGSVEQILVREGDEVKSGQVLIKLSQKDVLAQLNQAQAGYEAALAQLSNLENGQLPQQIAQLESAFIQAKSNFDNAKQNYERMEKLLTEGAIPEQQFENVKLQYEVAKEQYESAKTQLELTKEKTAPESIAAAKAQVKQAKAALSAAQVALDNTLITSPIDGTVGAINVSVGQLASPGVPVVTVGNLKNMEISINVTEDRINGLKVNQDAQVTVDSLDNTVLKGKIISISPFKNEMTQVYPVKILVPNEKGLLKSGMFARVKLMVALHENVVTVPEDAVVSYNGTKVVYTFEDGVAKANEVEIGPSSGGRTVIVKGLEAGKEVIVAGQEVITDGMKVKVEGEGDRQ